MKEMQSPEAKRGKTCPPLALLSLLSKPNQELVDNGAWETWLAVFGLLQEEQSRR